MVGPPVPGVQEAREKGEGRGRGGWGGMWREDGLPSLMAAINEGDIISKL